MALPSALLLRGTRAGQPAASTLAPGCTYCVTDENFIVEQVVTGAPNTWEEYSATGAGTGDVVGPGSATDNAVVRFDSTTGKLVQNSAVTIADTTGLIAGSRFANAGLKLEDTNASHLLTIAPGSDITADRTLTITTGDAARTLTFTGNASIGASTATRALTCDIDGGGIAITTGVKFDLYVPYACTITAVTMAADQGGSIVVDIWKDAYANFPPTVADTITAAAKPTLSAATKSQDTTLTGWTTSVTAGDFLRFNVDSAATITRLSLTLTVTA